MALIDLIIIAVYLLALFVWAIVLSRGETADGFFVFSRRAPFMLVLFSIVSTWVGIGTTVATAASGYRTGISLGATAVCGSIIGAFAAAWFAPLLKRFGDRFSAYTIGDFFRLRYSDRVGLLSSIAVLTVYFLLTAAQFMGLSALLGIWTGFGAELLVVFAAVSTVVYTAFAGIKSDFYTDFIHFLVMVVVLFFILLPVVIRAGGGMSALQNLPLGHLDLFAYGGIPFFIAGIIFGAGSVFVTMELWQRIYAASSERAAQYALGISVGMIALFYAVSAIFGLFARLLLPALGEPDQALFMLMKTYLPTGLLGLGVAAFMAIFVSTINSTIMVAASTITSDFYKRIWNPAADDRTMLSVGRKMTAIAGALSLCIALLLPDLVSLSVNALFVLLILLPGIVGGFFWNRANEKAAFHSILSGLLVTAFFLAINPDVAFIPGFIASLAVFFLFSRFARHDEREHLEILSLSRTVSYKNDLSRHTL